jgi:TolB-like protein
MNILNFALKNVFELVSVFSAIIFVCNITLMTVKKRNMKKISVFGAALLCLVLSSCGSLTELVALMKSDPASREAAGEPGAGGEGAAASQAREEAEQQTREEAAKKAESARPADPPYSGDGGKDISLAVLVPTGSGIAADQSYLPALAQGVFVGDFSRYSAIAVMDRQNLDKIIAENYSGYYEEDHPDLNKLGHLLPTGYIMTGAITKTGAGYALQMQIADNKTGITKASYTGNCTIAEFDNFTGIHRASADLLAQMGVTLKDNAKAELAGAGAARTVQAETALAKGVTAQQGGSIVAALNYYSQAADLHTDLAEADERLAALTRKIESGDIGENIRNDIEQRNAWAKLLEEAIGFYQKNPYYDLVYYTKPAMGDTNYRNNTVQVSFEIWIEPNAGYAAMFKILRALMATGMAEKWGLNGEMDRLARLGLAFSEGSGYMVLGAELLDEQGDYLGTLTGRVFAVPVVSRTSLVLRTLTREPLENKQIDAVRISNGMRLSGIRPLDNEEIQKIRNLRVALPFTGTLKAIPTEKPFKEYFRGRRNVETNVPSWVSTDFTFR